MLCIPRASGVLKGPMNKQRVLKDLPKWPALDLPNRCPLLPWGLVDSESHHMTRRQV